MLTDLWRLLTSPQARKAQIAIIAFVAAAASAGLFPPSIAIWINIGVSALTVAGVYVVPNTNTPILEPAKPAPVVELTVPEQKVETIYHGDVKG